VSPYSNPGSLRSLLGCPTIRCDSRPKNRASRVGRPRIEDDFASLPLPSDQKTRLRWKRDGRCVRCGGPRPCHRHTKKAPAQCAERFKWEDDIIEGLGEALREARVKEILLERALRKGVE